MLRRSFLQGAGYAAVAVAVPMLPALPAPDIRVDQAMGIVKMTGNYTAYFPARQIFEEYCAQIVIQKDMVPLDGVLDISLHTGYAPA